MGPPFGPFAEAIAAYARHADAETLRRDPGIGAAPIARVVAAVRERLPDVPEPMPLQPDEERFRLLDAVSQFLIATATRVPIVLVLDDLHWADKGTLAMLRHVARFAPQHRLLLLGTYRDVELDPQHPLTDVLGALYRETACERILLKGLDATDVAQLIADSEVPAERRDTVADEINAVTNGNPFFVREVPHHLAEERQLAREPTDGSRTAVDRIAIPDSVRQVLNRRVRRLGAETGRLLSAAAAFGGSFHVTVAARVAGLDEAAVLNAIDAALRAQLVRPAESAERYDFTHALIRETLYSELSPSRQVRLHRQVAEAMEQTYGDLVGEHAAAVAGQYHRSKDLPGAERGVPHAVTAADRAEAMYAHDEVVRLLRIALELTPRTARRPARLLGRLALRLTWVLDFDEAVQVAHEAGELIAATEGAAAAPTIWVKRPSISPSPAHCSRPSKSRARGWRTSVRAGISRGCGWRATTRCGASRRTQSIRAFPWTVRSAGR
jgi:predicted ATPase